MGMTSRQRDLRRRQRRVSRLRALKSKLLQTQDSRERERIIQKIHRLAPLQPLPKK